MKYYKDYWAVTYKNANKQLNFFLDNYLFNYGTFQDAINKDDPFLFHSLLSPYLNNGLLDPMECIKECEKRFFDNIMIIKSFQMFQHIFSV